MECYYYYVYCKGILAVKTNLRDFKWIYGTSAPSSTEQEFNECKIQFVVTVGSEKTLESCSSSDRKFQACLWDNNKKKLYYHRKLFKLLDIGYNINIDGNKVEVNLGKNYLKYIKLRAMNLHSAYYLLSDIANVLLLKNGLVSLYSSAVYYKPKEKCVVCFAPPNTGKTLTATRLCENKNYQMVSEDVVITDGKNAFSCPYTNSYRKSGSSTDSAGSFDRVMLAGDKEFRDKCEITDFAVLSLGKNEISTDKSQIAKKICLLNGYLFDYYTSPILVWLAFFDSEFEIPWQTETQKIIENMTERLECRWIQAESPTEFSKILEY